MKIYILTAVYQINTNGVDVELEEFIDTFTEYFDADAWFSYEIDVVRNSKIILNANKAILKLSAVPLRGNCLEKESTAIIRTVSV